MHVLRTYLVEDSAVIRENLIGTLEELVGAQVVGFAEDESAAVQWLQRPEHRADLVIVDVFLKRGSGLGVLKALQALPWRSEVVVLSNYATPAMRLQCLALGAKRVFDKSNDIDALIHHCTDLAAALLTQTGRGGGPA